MDPSGFWDQLWATKKGFQRLLQLQECLSHPKRGQIKAISGISGKQVQEGLENQRCTWIFSMRTFRAWELPGKATRIPGSGTFLAWLCLGQRHRERGSSALEFGSERKENKFTMMDQDRNVIKIWNGLRGMGP